MESDDLLPNDGSFFYAQEPADQAVARKKEKARTLEALPVLKDLIKQYDRDIAFYGSVDSIPAEVKTKPDEFIIVHNANELVRNVLMEKREYIISLLDAHAYKKL